MLTTDTALHKNNFKKLNYFMMTTYTMGILFTFVDTLNCFYWKVALGFCLIFASFNAQDIKMTVKKDPLCRCDEGLIQDIDNYVVNALVDLKRDVMPPDHVIFEISTKPDYKFQYYFVVNLKYDCNQVSNDTTITCTEIRPNVFNISKTDKASARLIGGKVRGFITGEMDNIYGDVKKIPDIFSTSDATGILQINGREILPDEYSNVTIKDTNLTLTFVCVTGATPCLITIKLNDSVVCNESVSHAEYSVQTSNGCESSLTIVYSDCGMSMRTKSINCLVKTEIKKAITEIADNMKNVSTEKKNLTTEGYAQSQQISVFIIVVAVIGTVGLIICSVIAIYVYKRKYGHLAILKRKQMNTEENNKRTSLELGTNFQEIISAPMVSIRIRSLNADELSQCLEIDSNVNEDISTFAKHLLKDDASNKLLSEWVTFNE